MGNLKSKSVELGIEDSTEKLESELQAYKHLFDISNDLLSITNFDGFFTKVNSKWVELLGFEEDELISRPFISFVHPDDKAETQKEAKALIEGQGEAIQFINRYQKKNGETIWLEWNTVADYEQKILFSVARDVSEKIRLQDFEKDVQELITSYSTEKIHRMPLDYVMNGLLRGLVKLFNVKTCSIWEFSESYESLACIYSSDSDWSPQESILKQHDFPYYFDATIQTKLVTAYKNQDDAISQELNNYFESFGISRLLDSQISFPSGRYGVICVEDNRLDKWQMVEIQSVASFSAIVANLFSHAELNDLLLKSRMLYEKTPIMMHTIDEEGGIISVSDLWLEKLGYDREEIIGRKATDFLSEESLKSAMGEELRKFNELGYCSNVPLNFIHKNGKVLSFRLSGLMHESSHGKQSMAVLEDQTEVNTLRNSLDKAGSLLESSSEIARIGFWQVDLKSMEVTWSKMTRMIHEVPEEYVPNVETAIEFYKEGESRERISNVFGYCIESGEPYDVECEIVTVKGTPKWIRTIGIPEKDPAGNVVYIHGLFQDIDEAKKRQLELEKLSLVASKTHTSVVITNAKGEIKWVNQGFTKLTEYSSKEVIGKKPGSILQGKNTSNDHIESIRNGLHTKKPFSQEIINYSKSGKEYWIDLTVTPIYNSDGEIKQFIGIQSDISERKWYEGVLEDIAHSFSMQRGTELFQNVSSYLTKSLEVDFAFVGEISKECDEVKILGGIANGQVIEIDSHALKDTPCEKVLEEGISYYPDKLPEYFPKDHIVKGLNLSSFMGSALVDDKNNPIGVVAIMSKEPFRNGKHADYLMKVFKERLSAEILRMSAERDLRDSEERYRSLTETATMGIAVHQKGIIKYMNPFGLELLEAGKPSDVVGNSIATFLSPKSMELASERIKKLYSGEILNAEALEEELISFQGRPFSVLLSGVLISYEGEPAICNVFADISQLKTTHQKLKQTKEKLENLNMVLEERVTERTEELNTANEGLMRRTKELQEAINHLIKNEKELKAKHRELQLVNRELSVSQDQARVLNDQLSDSNEVLSSQKLELEETLRNLKKTQSQLIQSEKMASLGILTAGVAHELNNPLNYIMGGMQALGSMAEKMNTEDAQHMRDIMNVMNNGLSKATELVKSLNHFNRKNQNLNQQVNVLLVVRNCLNMIQTDLDKVDVKVDISANCTVIGNESKLHQLFINLLKNAQQAIGESGGEIVITGRQKSPNFIIKIKDSGIGIPKENLDKVMDPFFTTKVAGEGTGLGLSIVYNIVNELKGTIKFKSQPGNGTEVTLGFPILIPTDNNSN